VTGGASEERGSSRGVATTTTSRMAITGMMMMMATTRVMQREGKQASQKQTWRSRQQERERIDHTCDGRCRACSIGGSHHPEEPAETGFAFFLCVFVCVLVGFNIDWHEHGHNKNTKRIKRQTKTKNTKMQSERRGRCTYLTTLLG